MRIGAKLIGLLLLGAIAAPLRADDAVKDAADKTSQSELSKKEKLYQRFEEKMSGVRLRGRFTVLGKTDKPSEEEYIIKKVERVPDTKDLWAFTASMEYNNKKRSFVVPIPVKWTDDTPVISMSNLALPGLGTFSCRVLIYNGKYAGTWKHGKVGGHMFGVVEPFDAQEDEKEKKKAGKQE